MTSSNTYNFSATNADIVLAAYERISIRAPSLRQEHMFTARRELNFLLSEFSNKEVNLWKVTRTQTTLTSGTATYTLPASTIMVLDASIVQNYGTSSETRRYITPISRTEYLSFGNQQVTGSPTVFWLNRQITPTVTFWPIPDSGGPYTFDYFSCIQMQDANLAGGETPDIPYRWIDCLIAGLSHRLSRVYAPELEAVRKADAAEAWNVAASQDTENVALTLAPSIGLYYR